MSPASSDGKNRSGNRRSPPVVAGKRVPITSSSQSVRAAIPAVESIDLLTSAIEYKADPNVTLSVAADAPPGYSGVSFRASFPDLAAGSTSRIGRRVTLDLSGYGDQASFRLWVKTSSLENLGHVYLILWSDSGWVAWSTKPPVARSWQGFILPKASPPGSGGTVNWSAIDTIYLHVDASAGGSYTGEVLWRDLRIRR